VPTAHPISDPTASVSVTVGASDQVAVVVPGGETVTVLASGMPGPNGRDVELRATSTHLEWRPVGATSWNSLVALSDLQGPAGREVELQSTPTHLQWRYVGDPAWTNLLDLATITREAEWTYVHTQSTPSAVWSISHSLNGYPNVTVVDSANTVVEGDVTYLSTDAVTVEFSSPFGGKAFLS